MRVVVKPWGEENIYVENEKYVFKTLFIKKNARISKQYHPIKDETYFIIYGKALIEYVSDTDTFTRVFTKEDAPLRIRPNVVHRVTAVTDLMLAEVSTGEQTDIVRLDDDYGRVDRLNVISEIKSNAKVA